MSVASLISQHGYPVAVIRPTQSVNAQGAMQREYYNVADLRAFVQPRSANDAPFSGRALMQEGATFYFSGRPDIRTDDLLRATLPSGNLFYHVTGVTVPLERGASRQNTHTIVETVGREGDTVTIVVAP